MGTCKHRQIPGRVTICEVVAGGLAEKAGLHVGDRLVQISGSQVRSMDHAVSLLQAGMGAVKLLIAPAANGNASSSSKPSSQPPSQPSSNSASLNSSPTASGRRGSAFDFMNGAAAAAATGAAATAESKPAPAPAVPSSAFSFLN